MRVKFTHDYQGHLAHPYFYAAGVEAEMDEDTALELIRLQHAEAVVVPAPVVVEDEPEGLPETTTESVFLARPFEDHTRAELYAMATVLNLDVTSRTSKDELIAALEANDESEAEANGS